MFSTGGVECVPGQHRTAAEPAGDGDEGSGALRGAHPLPVGREGGSHLGVRGGERTTEGTGGEPEDGGGR